MAGKMCPNCGKQTFLQMQMDENVLLVVTRWWYHPTKEKVEWVANVAIATSKQFLITSVQVVVLLIVRREQENGIHGYFRQYDGGLRSTNRTPHGVQKRI